VSRPRAPLTYSAPEQLHVEDERGVAGDVRGRPPLAVALIIQNVILSVDDEAGTADSLVKSDVVMNRR
jgi:hypothetical protein